jgi:hypothetical protein
MFASESFLKALRQRTEISHEQPKVSHTCVRPTGTLTFVSQPGVGVGGQLWEVKIMLLCSTVFACCTDVSEGCRGSCRLPGAT